MTPSRAYLESMFGTGRSAPTRRRPGRRDKLIEQCLREYARQATLCRDELTALDGRCQVQTVPRARNCHIQEPFCFLAFVCRTKLIRFRLEFADRYGRNGAMRTARQAHGIAAAPGPARQIDQKDDGEL